MSLTIARIAGLAAVVLIWMWSRDARWTEFRSIVVIWCAPLLTYPITLVGLSALAGVPTARRAEWTTLAVHYAAMMALGVAFFRAIPLVTQSPGIRIPIPEPVGLAVTVVTGLATFLTVVNLALRGWGAPFAAKLSSRLATDWTYAWTRNPMLLCSLAWLTSFGLMYRSLWFVAWMAIVVSPGWIFLVKTYEERELALRFGNEYERYRARTPFLWPRKPAAAGTRVSTAG
jgi:protein-S-isoprenylcysteine O-methyltransferase Ste14